MQGDKRYTETACMRAAHDPAEEDRIGSMEFQLISVEELEKASNRIKDAFMNNEIHRFPAGLLAVGERYIVPTVVAIGPYHRGSDHLQKMEDVKLAAAFQFHRTQGWLDKPLPEKFRKDFLNAAGLARNLYAGDAVVGMTHHDFAEMMFIDACFLLQYMDFYSFFKSNKNFGVDESLRRFLFPNRACINNDIMLLENQLPWLVIRTIINSLSHAKDYMRVVNEFIADMGNAFNIDQDVKAADGTSSVASNNKGWTLPCLKSDETTDTSVVSNAQDNTQDGKETYIKEPHLLGLLRRHKTEVGTKVEWSEVSRIPTAIELAEIGIKLKASKPPALFTDMDVRKRGPLCGELSLASLSLNDTRACWLVNMAAFEVSTASSLLGDHPNKTAVCSYLALLSMLMLREEDVRELRSKHILQGPQTNAEMLAFFNKVTKLLPDTGCRFAHIIESIENYKKNRWLRTKVHQFVYNNFTTIIKLVTIIGTLVGIIQALLSVNQA